jgi:hypothetical protein
MRRRYVNQARFPAEIADHNPIAIDAGGPKPRAVRLKDPAGSLIAGVLEGNLVARIN